MTRITSGSVVKGGRNDWPLKETLNRVERILEKVQDTTSETKAQSATISTKLDSKIGYKGMLFLFSAVIAVILREEVKAILTFFAQ